MRIHQTRRSEAAWQALGAGLWPSSEPAGVVYPEIDWPVAVRQPRGAHRP